MNEVSDLFSQIRLSRGSHDDPAQGLCVMECVSHIQGEGHTDSPGCACPVISAFAVRTNDAFDDTNRQALTDKVIRIAGSRADHAVAVQRLAFLLNYVVHEYLPRLFRQLGYTDYAEQFSALPHVVTKQEGFSIAPTAKLVSDSIIAEVRARLKGADDEQYQRLFSASYMIELALERLQRAMPHWSEGYLRSCVQELSDALLVEPSLVDRFELLDKLLDIGASPGAGIAVITPDQLERLRALAAISRVSTKSSPYQTTVA